MSDLQRLSRDVIGAKVFAEALASMGKASKADLLEQAQEAGAERIRVRDSAGQDVGAVVLCAGATTATVVDEAAFTAWVAQRYPEKIITVRAVRDGFARQLLDAAAKVGDPVDVAGGNGEVIPGVKVTQAEPYLQARPTVEAYARARQLLAAGQLSLTAAPTAADAAEEAGPVDTPTC
jgi:hypothetical protein